MTAAVIFVFVVVVGIAGRIVIGDMFLSATREIMRSSPEARQAFIAAGGWACFSRKFGLPYAIALIVGGFVWLVVCGKLVPDTNLGAWIIFGPSFTMLILGALLGTLWAARRVVDL
jgi:hypothetical protein